ncbi:hypothetical protein FTE28_07230 [Bacillus licheniformis]|nr:hypothetical protein FTE28_07230 [Bacillus licheniformis]
MFQNKIKKAVGAVAFAGALLVSGLPVSADTLPELIWVRDKYPGAQYEYKVINGERYVDVYRVINGKTDVTREKCETMYQDRCYVKNKQRAAGV